MRRESLFVRFRSLFSFVRKESGRRRGNDEGKMTRKKKKIGWGKSHTYRHYSNSAVPKFRSTNEKWLSIQTRFSPLGRINGRNLMVLDSRIRTEKYERRSWMIVHVNGFWKRKW
jgi:hypothetical protein